MVVCIISYNGEEWGVSPSSPARIESQMFDIQRRHLNVSGNFTASLRATIALCHNWDSTLEVTSRDVSAKTIELYWLNSVTKLTHYS